MEPLTGVEALTLLSRSQGPKSPGNSRNWRTLKVRAEMIFKDRRAAGQFLGRRLAVFANRSDVVVLGLARGGMPVAYEIAKAIRAPLDVLIVRKLGVPGQEELAMGAIAPCDVQVINPDVVQLHHLSDADIQHVTRQERQELERRERLYRGDRPLPTLQGRTVILVDDGLATGATMRAAIQSVKHWHPAKIVVTVPVASIQACREIGAEVDEMYCGSTPEQFFGVGQWYENFTQTTDAEVCTLLQQSYQQARSVLQGLTTSDRGQS